MMIKKLFFWLVFLSVGMQAQNVSFADANFKQALLGFNPNNPSSNNFVLCYDQNGNNILVDQNNDDEIQLSEAALVYRIDFRQISNYTTLEGINSFVNLESMYYINDSNYSHIHGKIGDISIDGLSKLRIFNLSGCDIGNASFKNCPQLSGIASMYTDTHNASDFAVHGNTQALMVDNCQQVNTIVWTNNNLAVSNITDCPSLTHLELRGNSLVTFDASQLTNLEHLDVSNNQTESGYMSGEADFDPTLSNLNTTGLSKLKNINVNNQLLTSLNLTDAILLEVLMCRNNKLSNLDLTANSKIFNVDCSKNQLTEIDFGSHQYLKNLVANNNLLTNQAVNISELGIDNMFLDLSYNLLDGAMVFNSSIASFFYLNLNHNTITDFTVNGSIGSNGSGTPTIDLSNNRLNHFKVTEDTNISQLNLDNNPIQELDLPLMFIETITANTSNLKYIKIKGLKSLTLDNIMSQKFNLVTLDPTYYAGGGGLLVTNNMHLEEIDLSESFLPLDSVTGNPLLMTINTKNGIKDYVSNNSFVTPFENNNNLKYICVDDDEIASAKDVLNYYGYDNVNINSYCSFSPGGNHNTISGTVKIDANNNGCDSTDNPFEHLKLKIEDGTNAGETFVQNDGKYEFYTLAGSFNVTALAENPSLFTVSPANFSTNFVDANNNSLTQDICVTANGTQNDAEVIIAPLTSARPGFDAVYNLVWRNKGNTTLSGKVILNYDSNKMTFQSSSLPYSTLSNGSIEFDYANLKPFANTATEITFKINTPTDPTNPVNMGDVLAFNAQITPSNTDITPEDNLFSFKHIVVNSFDPNDIICLEGETVPVSTVGKYLHYVINFENTGNAEAENIVVKMDVDPNEFDINTLQLQNASADVDTKIVGNKVEFVFKKIKLQSGGHGGVLLKMKSKSNLVEGDAVNNKAEIYFDYNFPIETNDYVTTIFDANNLLSAKINYSATNFSQNNYPIKFDASLSTGSITNYQWEFSGNPSISSSTDIKPVVTYNVPGNYKATLMVSDSNGASSFQTIMFSVGGNVADLSTGKNSDNNFITIDTDEDDWKGYDINGVEITPKVRHTYTGWSYADISNGQNSQWITLNNLEGYYTYKSRAFTIPDNATDGKLNLRSLSFVRNWTYLVKVNPDGSETETEITKTQWMNDGFKGWLNSRSPKVDNYSLSPGTYYIKVFLYSNNNLLRQSIDVNAIVSCSEGLIFASKMVQKQPTLDIDNFKDSDIKVYPIPSKGLINIISDEKINTIEVYDSAGRIVQKQMHSSPSKESKININSPKGIYYLKIKTNSRILVKKIIKE